MITLLLIVAAQVAMAAIEDTTGLKQTAAVYGGVTADKPEAIIGKVVGAALAFLGIAFFALMVVGGYRWMFSMGNEQTATKAKDIIIAAVIGLAIVLIAYALTTFIAEIFLT